MKIKIKRSMSPAVDGSHPALEEGAELVLDEKTSKYLIEIGNAIEVKPAVKVKNKPTSAKKAVK